MRVPDEGYSRNASRALNLISTFLIDMDLVRLWHVLCRQVHSLKASLANYAVPCLARPKINKVVHMLSCFIMVMDLVRFFRQVHSLKTYSAD